MRGDQAAAEQDPVQAGDRGGYREVVADAGGPAACLPRSRALPRLPPRTGRAGSWPASGRPRAGGQAARLSPSAAGPASDGGHRMAAAPASWRNATAAWRGTTALPRIRVTA